MAILKNKKGLKGEETTPVALPYSFMNAVFNIEKEYNSDETFTIIKDGVPRLQKLHHLNNADIQVATILLKACFTSNGKLTDVTRYSIYQSLLEHYEKPIQPAAFYTSLEKFKLHGIITETKVEHSGRYNYQLNHYVDSATSKIGMYVALPPLVFTEEFDALDLAHKKLFYSVYISQNEDPNKIIERSMETEKENVQFSGLYNFLHRKDPYQIRMILKDLLTKTVQGKPLFSHAELVKDGKRYHKALFRVNSEIIPTKEEKSVDLHEPIPLRMVYRRKANFIQRLLEEWNLGELVSYHNSKFFYDLIHILKNHGYRVIRHAIYQLKKFFDEYCRLPADIIQFINTVVRNKTQASIMSAAAKIGVVDFIAPIQERGDRKNREFEFASNLSRNRLGIRQIENMFSLALPVLKERYGRPAVEHLSESDYGVPSNEKKPLQGDLFQVIYVARKSAFRLMKHPRLYNELESTVIDVYYEEHGDNGFDRSEFAEWVLRQVEELPEVDIAPVVPLDFKLEDFIVQNFIGQVY